VHRAWQGFLAVIAACGLALALGGCEGGDPADDALGAGGRAIPGTSPAAEPPSEKKRSGAPKVAQFRHPPRFWCLEAHPGQAQVIVGWSAPAAKKVAVLLDGEKLHAGIRERLPFWVPAGDASGIGATVVFGCDAGERHRITVRWRARSGPATARRLMITKAAQP
jgi:hypothetical protein